MFTGKKYISRGIDTTLNLDMQVLLWGLIDDLNKRNDLPIDYLQIFELSSQRIDDILIQKITHRKEIPFCQREYYIITEEAIDEKVYVIDSEEYVTMILASEY